jgi:zinc-ribbon domain
MTKYYCPECGHENPIQARFCMDCGRSLTGASVVSPDRQLSAVHRSHDSGTDWAGVVAAVLAFLSLRRMSRKTRQATLVVTFLLLFFGCPMACCFAMFVVDSIVGLFR